MTSINNDPGLEACESTRCRGQAILAIDRYESEVLGTISLCEECSNRLGKKLERLGYDFIPYYFQYTTTTTLSKVNN